MTIIERIKKDHLDSRKAKDKALTSVLTTLMGEVQIVGKNDGNRETTDEEALKVIGKFKKGVDETIKLIDAKTDLEKHEDLCYEGLVYDKYLPKQMTSDELEAAVAKIIDIESRIATKTLSMKDMGAIMQQMKNTYGSTFDGKEASQLIKAKL